MTGRLKIIFLFLFLLFFPLSNLVSSKQALAYAGHCAFNPNPPNQTVVQTEIGWICTDPEGLVKDILTVILGIAGGVALLLMLFGGGMYVMSSGNPEKTEEAQKILTAAISGALLIFLSIFLLKFIGVNLLSIPGLQGPGGGIQTP